MLIIGRERGKGPIGKIPGESPDKSGKSPGKSQKDKKGQKRKDKSRSGNPPRLKHPRLAALEGQEIAARNRRSLATFHRTLKSQCIICCLGNRAISGVRDGHRNGKSQRSLRFRCAKIFSIPEGPAIEKIQS